MDFKTLLVLIISVAAETASPKGPRPDDPTPAAPEAGLPVIDQLIEASETVSDKISGLTQGWLLVILFAAGVVILVLLTVFGQLLVNLFKRFCCKKAAADDQ